MISKLRYIQFGATQEHYKVVILIKEDSLNKDELLNAYIKPIIKENPSLKQSDFVALNLDYDGKTAKVNDTIKPWLKFLSTMIKCDLLLVADSAYFKVLTSTKKTGHAYGSIVDCTFEDFKGIKAALTMTYRSVFYDDKNQNKIDLTNRAISAELSGNSLFEDIVHHAEFPHHIEKIKKFLNKLLDFPILSCDIEAFSLKHYEAKLGSISFAWNQHEGGGFLVDYQDLPYQNPEGEFGKCVTNSVVRKVLGKFFYEYLVVRRKRIIWHNISYDAKVLIWELIMEANHTKKVELIQGLEMFADADSFEDTKIIAYLATNSAAGNDLKLKTLALPFAGNYALESDEINDIRRVKSDSLLRYNLIDCLSTFYVYNEYYSRMVADKQLDVYNTIFKPSVKVLMQAELHGMPLDMSKVLEAEKQLTAIVDNTLTRIGQNPYVIEFIEAMRCKTYFYVHLGWKTKSLPLHDSRFDFSFNMNSPNQLVSLLYDMLDLPVLDKTETGQPAAGTKTLKALKSHTQDPIIQEILDTVIEFNGAIKILSAFIPAFKEAYYCPISKWHYLMGNFNLGGTVSGRLSCSNPNLQQIPSGSTYAKLIKACFVAPKGKLMVGLDFNSLEDYISALTTKDPNKLKVYTDGYDGHCLRAFSYFPERLPGIVDTVESINSIKEKYPVVRQDSKAPTFALTYQGTWSTLMRNCGFTKDVAVAIEDNFKELYKVSIQYVDEKLEEASKTGYVEVAFGLKVRTPVIEKSLWNSEYTPSEAKAEGRTAGNALGQSYGMLNNRAAIDFQRRTLASAYRLMIWPIAHIHDAQYFCVDEDVALLAWMNKELVDCVEWQELPEIQHDTVKIGGELSVFYPSWANEMVLKNSLETKEEIAASLQASYKKYKEELDEHS